MGESGLGTGTARMTQFLGRAFGAPLDSEGLDCVASVTCPSISKVPKIVPCACFGHELFSTFYHLRDLDDLHEGSLVVVLFFDSNSALNRKRAPVYLGSRIVLKVPLSYQIKIHLQTTRCRRCRI